MSFRIRSANSRNSCRNDSQIHLGMPQGRERTNRNFPKNNQCSKDMPMIGGELADNERPRQAWPRGGQTSPADVQAGMERMSVRDLDPQKGDGQDDDMRQQKSPGGLVHVNSSEWDSTFYEKHTRDIPRPCRHRTRGLGRAFMNKDNQCSWMRNMQELQQKAKMPLVSVPDPLTEPRREGNERLPPPEDAPVCDNGNAPAMSAANSDWYMAQMQNIQRQQQLLYQQQQTLLHKMASVCPTPTTSYCHHDPNNSPGYAPSNNQGCQQPPGSPGGYGQCQSSYSNPSSEGQTLAEKSQAAKEVYENLLQQQHDQVSQQIQQQQHQQHQLQQQQSETQQHQAYDDYDATPTQSNSRNAGPHDKPQNKAHKRRLKGHMARNYAARDEGMADLVIFHRGKDDDPPEEMEISAKEQDSRNDFMRAASAQPSVSHVRSCYSHMSDNLATPRNGPEESVSLYGQDPSEKRAVGALSDTRKPFWNSSTNCGNRSQPPAQSPGDSVPPTPPNTSANNTATLLKNVKRRLENEQGHDGKVSPSKSVGGCRRSPSKTRASVDIRADDPGDSGREREWWEAREPPKELAPLD